MSNNPAASVLLIVLSILAMGIAGAGANSPISIVRACASDQTDWYVVEGGAAMFPAKLEYDSGELSPVRSKRCGASK